jgi:hypothetical protein
LGDGAGPATPENGWPPTEQIKMKTHWDHNLSLAEYACYFGAND